jgi:Lytic polysaccharide mono-oxygenase, cellulose-degrading
LTRPYTACEMYRTVGHIATKHAESTSQYLTEHVRFPCIRLRASVSPRPHNPTRFSPICTLWHLFRRQPPQTSVLACSNARTSNRAPHFSANRPPALHALVLPPRAKMASTAVVSRAAVLCAAVVLGLASTAAAHGFLSYPNARGALSGSEGKYKYKGVADQCPKDYCPMCQNAGFLQKNHGNDVFVPYNPMDRTQWMRGRFGMCGDNSEAFDAPHMKNGFFSKGCEGFPAITGLRPGSVVNLQIQSTAHHQGFFETFLCNTRNCGGDITRNCFDQNQCVQLQRVPHPSCESGNDHECSPIDFSYPGRWHIPCPAYPFLFEGTSEMTEDQTLGGPNGKMAFKIPDDFNCGKNCVLQSYWVTANTCNPAGYKEYFDWQYNHGHLESWKQCPGDGITHGGYAPSYPTCGDKGTYPEEFWNCADIHMDGEEFNTHDYSPYYLKDNNGQKPWHNLPDATAPVMSQQSLPEPNFQCGKCKFPESYEGQRWFVTGHMKDNDSRFMVCLEKGPQQICMWCDNWTDYPSCR